MSALQLQISGFGFFIPHSTLCIPQLVYMAEKVGFEPTLGFPKHAFQACAFSQLGHLSVFNFGLLISDCGMKNPQFTFRNPQLCLAEREGFEPPVELPPQQISSLPPSASSATSPI
jgi:hypothetical protein